MEVTRGERPVRARLDAAIARPYPRAMPIARALLATLAALGTASLGCGPSVVRDPSLRSGSTSESSGASDGDGEGSAAPPSPASPAELSAARLQFSTLYSCPDDRIRVSAAGVPTPPPAVAADPARLAVWQKSHTNAHLLDVSGCDHKKEFDCQALGDDDAFCSLSFRALDGGQTSVVTVEATQGAGLTGSPVLGLAMYPIEGVGILVVQVVPGSPADGKLQAGDVILAAAGQSVSDAPTFRGIEAAHAGQRLELRVLRHKNQVTVSVDVPKR